MEAHGDTWVTESQPCMQPETVRSGVETYYLALLCAPLLCAPLCFSCIPRGRREACLPGLYGYREAQAT